MTLKEYLKEVNKGKCPEECKFKRRKDIKIALISPPDKISGIVISQDPTVRWSHFYRYSKNELGEDTRRKMLFVSAILYLLFNRIIEFMDERITHEDGEYLFDRMFQEVYWTHLHKCFTDKSEEKSFKFERKNANECAGRWLTKELNLAINNKTKFIIALGNNVRKWVKTWKEKDGRDKMIEIINLPHPSGLNRKWNNKEDEDISKAIEKLTDLCRENLNFSQSKQSPNTA